jgi:putative endonuclease
MSHARQSLGAWGESAAAAYLESKGYTIRGRNVRTPYGEIDLVAEKDGSIVFVEVKTRSLRSAGDRTFGAPEVAVSARKQAHMISSAEAYRQAHPELEADWRIDVIAIERKAGADPQLVHFENAV